MSCIVGPITQLLEHILMVLLRTLILDTWKRICTHFLIIRTEVYHIGNKYFYFCEKLFPSVLLLYSLRVTFSLLFRFSFLLCLFRIFFFHCFILFYRRTFLRVVLFRFLSWHSWATKLFFFSSNCLLQVL